MTRAHRRRRHAPKLKRGIDLLTAVVYGIGIIFGAGIYSVISPAAALAGNSLWLSFLVAAFVAAFTGLSYMELISMFPKDAAEYVYVKSAFRNRLLAFDVGWVEVFTDVIAVSAVSLGFAGYFTSLFDVPAIPVALGLIAAMSAMNFWGIKDSSKLNFALSGIALGGLLLVILVAVVFGHGKIASTDFLYMPNGLTGVFGGAAMIFFAYIGFEELANLSEETKDARRTLPRALLISVAVTTAVYMLISVSVVGLVGWEQLAASKAPLALAVSTVFGSNAFWLVSVIALFTTASTVLVGLIVSSRILYGMAKSGTLPRALCRIHAKRNTPWVAVLTSMLLSMAIVLLGGSIGAVASVTDMGTFFIFAFVNASVILLRYRMPHARREFRVPFNVGRFPVVPFLGLVVSLLLATHLGAWAIAAGFAIAASGVAAYLFFVKRKR